MAILPSPMRITHVVETLERGGLERVVVDLCGGLRRAGHDVDIVCLFREGVLAEEARSRGVPVRALGKEPGLDFGSLRSLHAHCAAMNPHVVHSHNAMAGYYAAITALGARRRVRISTRHGMGDSARITRKERLYRLSLAAYDAVAVVCQEARSSFVRAGLVPDSMATVVPNGIALERFAARDRSARVAARHALNLEEQDLVVGTVGRLNWAKDHALLVEAFDRARRQIGQRTKLVIVGEGELRPSIEQLVRQKNLTQLVRLPGDRADVAQLLSAMDIFACSSKTEGYSVALLEAAATGLPMIATRVGGNAEIVRDNGTGLLTPPGDMEAFAAAIVRLSDSSLLRDTLGGSARRWAMEAASVDSMVERYVSLYRRF